MPRNTPFIIKKIIKAHRKMDRKPTTNEARSEIENMIRKDKSGDLSAEQEQMKAELEGIAPLVELSKLLQY